MNGEWKTENGEWKIVAGGPWTAAIWRSICFEGSGGQRRLGSPVIYQAVDLARFRLRNWLPCYNTRVMKWRVVLEKDPETGEWAAWCPELPGCTSAGETEDDAMTNIREAIELYLEPDPIPMPPAAVIREVTV